MFVTDRENALLGVERQLTRLIVVLAGIDGELNVLGPAVLATPSAPEWTRL